jgi:hypothetical protein
MLARLRQWSELSGSNSMAFVKSATASRKAFSATLLPLASGSFASSALTVLQIARLATTHIKQIVILFFFISFSFQILFMLPTFCNSSVQYCELMQSPLYLGEHCAFLQSETEIIPLPLLF